MAGHVRAPSCSLTASTALLATLPPIVIDAMVTRKATVTRRATLADKVRVTSKATVSSSASIASVATVAICANSASAGRSPCRSSCWSERPYCLGEPGSLARGSRGSGWPSRRRCSWWPGRSTCGCLGSARPGGWTMYMPLADRRGGTVSKHEQFWQGFRLFCWGRWILPIAALVAVGLSVWSWRRGRV